MSSPSNDLGRLQSLHLEAVVEEVVGGGGGLFSVIDHGFSGGGGLEGLERGGVVREGEIRTQGLCTLANRGPGLSKVSLRGRRFWDGRDTTTASFEPFGDNLKHLDLGHCWNVYDTTLFKAIGSSGCSITVLNLERSRITDCGLRFLTDGSCANIIKELVLGGCRYITDSGVLLMRKMCVLEEVSLAFCKRVTDVGGVAISAIGTLKKLNLVSGPKVTDTTIVALAKNCLNLETLELRHNEFVTGDGIRAFGSQMLASA
ncbi:hypothetical protein ACLB2K_065586 [Fragaria x ananassa]